MAVCESGGGFGHSGKPSGRFAEGDLRTAQSTWRRDDGLALLMYGEIFLSSRVGSRQAP
jgi:hypothetical protein